MEPTIDHAVDTVNHHISHDARVPPLVFARMARGGKTTFLCELFDRLRAENKAVTLITLLNLTRRSDEIGRDTLLRLIALQLLPDMTYKEAVNIKVDEAALFQHIDATRDGRPWVLLIDELNNLGVPMDVASSNFLRKILDHKGYYVVFTSRVPLDMSVGVAGLANTYLVVSDRELLTVPMPTCTDVSVLSRMFGDREPALQVTPSEVAILLGIPSLIYDFKRHYEGSLVARFERQRITVQPDEHLNVIQSFLNEVVTGKQDPEQRSSRFYMFGQMPQEMRIQWPICYIACILDMPAFNLCLDMRGTVDRLAVHAERTESGLDWEIVVQVAILLQSLNAKVNKGRAAGPFDIVDDEQCDFVVTREFPVNVVTIEAANDFIENELAKREPGTILVATPKYAKFPDYDVIVAYKRQNGTVRKFGVQVKLGRTYPKQEVADCLEAAFLVRGCAPTANNTKGKWKYCGEGMVKELVGYSLAPLIPQAWPAVPAVDTYD
jgi:hypothetical protein